MRGGEVPGGKQKKELIGTSVEEARDADGKRRVQKRENRIFNIKPETKMTFKELTDWFLVLEKVKPLAYYPTLQFCLDRFNGEFGSMVVSHIRPIDLENYQAKRKVEGRANSTIDHQIAAARRMVIKAFDNGKVSLKERAIKLEARDTKDKEPGLIPICDNLREILKALPYAIHDDHVFLYKGKPIKDIRTTLINACSKAVIPYGRFSKDGFMFHDLRHTFNPYMRKADVKESVIMDITGHSTREMFDRYNTIDMDDAHDAMKKLEGFFANVTQDVIQTVIPGV